MNFFRKKHHRRFVKGSVLLVKVAALLTSVVFFYSASAIESDNFELENPINVVSGGQSSSASFQYLSTTSQDSQAQITSTSFIHNVGFMYFPVATSPVVSATPGDGEVTLSWTAANGTFANITSYSVGTSTTLGGPYTYTSVGNVLTSIRTGLNNGTVYYFKIRSFAAGLLLSESAEVSATPEAAQGGGTSGGSGGPTYGDTGVNFSGRAYPLSRVSILKDGQLTISTIAGPDSKFSANISNMSAGNYTFSVYGEDKDKRRSSPFTFQVYLTAGTTTNISGIFVAPTIAVDKSQVKKGDNIAIFGQSAQKSEIIISVNSEPEFFETTQSDEDGIYLFNFDSSVLAYGEHSTKSKAKILNELSAFGASVGFAVGTENILADEVERLAKCDLNNDNRCNLIDFSIAAFWYKRPLSPEFIIREKAHLSGDGKVDLVDFSIMAYYWTG